MPKLNMDGQVLAAIIGAAAVIIAVLIPYILKRIRKPTQKEKLSIGFQFGYYTMELYYTIKFKYAYESVFKNKNYKIDEDYKIIQEKLILESKGKCQNLAKQLAIDFKAETIEHNKDVYDQPAYTSEIETAVIILPINVQYCIKSARRLSAVFHRDYQFNFLNLMGYRFTKEQITFVRKELDDEISKSQKEFKKTHLNIKLLKGGIDYINSLRNASYLSKEDWALSFMKMRGLIEDVASRINQ